MFVGSIASTHFDLANIGTMIVVVSVETTGSRLGMDCSMLSVDEIMSRIDSWPHVAESVQQ